MFLGKVFSVEKYFQRVKIISLKLFFGVWFVRKITDGEKRPSTRFRQW